MCSQMWLVVDEEYLIPNTIPLLGWLVKGHKIDYEMQVPDGTHWAVCYSEDSDNSYPYRVELYLKKLHNWFQVKLLAAAHLRVVPKA